MTNRRFVLLSLVLFSAFIVGLVGCSSPKTDDASNFRETISALEAQVSSTMVPNPSRSRETISTTEVEKPLEISASTSNHATWKWYINDDLGLRMLVPTNWEEAPGINGWTKSFTAPNLPSSNGAGIYEIQVFTKPLPPGAQPSHDDLFTLTEGYLEQFKDDEDYSIRVIVPPTLDEIDSYSAVWMSLEIAEPERNVTSIQNYAVIYTQNAEWQFNVAEFAGLAKEIDSYFEYFTSNIKFLPSNRGEHDSARTDLLFTGKINGKKIHLRQAPNLNNKKWVHVPFGTQFSVVSRTPDGQWVQVCCVEGAMGWVRTKYIDLSNSNWTSIPTTPQSSKIVSDSTPLPTRTPAPVPTKILPTRNSDKCLSLLSPGDDPGDCFPQDYAIPEEETWTEEEFCENVWYPGIEKDFVLDYCVEYWDKLNTTGSTSACPNGCTTHVQGCDIKGNISIETGEKIYHLPSDKYYKKTIIRPQYGERWFCTRDEAEANGWRHARR